MIKEKLYFVKLGFFVVPTFGVEAETGLKGNEIKEVADS
jgi:hypothetical protein